MANFRNWLGVRENNLSEIFGLFRKRDDTPTEPGQIYTHPKVEQYYREVLSRLGVVPGLKLTDGRGNEVGDFDGHVPPQVGEAVRRLVAAYIFGKSQEKSFLRVSHQDAGVVVNFLDRLRVPGQTTSLADDIHVNDPRSLTHWLQTKLPTAPDALYQTDFDQGNQAFLDRRLQQQGRRLSPLRHQQVRDLYDASSQVVQFVDSRRSQRSIGTRSLVAITDQIRDALARLGPGVPGRPPAAPPSPPLSPSGTPGHSAP